MAAFLSIFRRGLDQDMVDNVNGFWSVLLLALCSAGAFLVRYITDPTSCWYPAHLTASHVSYSDHACFLTDVFYQPYTSYVPKSSHERVPSYHLWIPLILFFQALAFKVPNIIWNSGKNFLTFNMDETVESMKCVQLTNAENRQAIFSDAARVFGSLLRRNRFFLALLYLFVKILSCVNLIAQFMFLTIYFRQYLAIRVGSYAGLDMGSIVKPLLVKHVFCDIDVYMLKNLRKFTVQCILPITEIYEKMFIFLWYWVFLLAVITILNLVLWAGFLFIPFLRDGRIAAHINAAKGSRPDEPNVTRFIRSFLGIDGVLVLAMISRNSSELVAADLTQHLYQVFQEKEEDLQNQRHLCTGEPECGIVRNEATGTVAALPMSELPSGPENSEKAPIV
ncbi:innexin unc-9-like [Haliotis rufescens]|uniref:innexin unc-9-like n=1 Tax=Haliotis rufescens TaxID=6454 RepID=UPI00201F2967|nr:innexin unc-9-like [Haliotis rufescens]